MADVAQRGGGLRQQVATVRVGRHERDGLVVQLRRALEREGPIGLLGGTPRVFGGAVSDSCPEMFEQRFQVGILLALQLGAQAGVQRPHLTVAKAIHTTWRMRSCADSRVARSAAPHTMTKPAARSAATVSRSWDVTRAAPSTTDARTGRPATTIACSSPRAAGASRSMRRAISCSSVFWATAVGSPSCAWRSARQLVDEQGIAGGIGGDRLRRLGPGRDVIGVEQPLGQPARSVRRQR